MESGKAVLFNYMKVIFCLPGFRITRVVRYRKTGAAYLGYSIQFHGFTRQEKACDTGLIISIHKTHHLSLAVIMRDIDDEIFIVPEFCVV
jgi:hypothetical protein